MNESIREKLHQIKRNFVPSIITSVIIMFLCLGIGAFIIKSNSETSFPLIKSGIASKTFLEAVQILIASPWDMFIILAIGFIIFIICAILEDR